MKLEVYQKPFSEIQQPQNTSIWNQRLLKPFAQNREQTCGKVVGGGGEDWNDIGGLGAPIPDSAPIPDIPLMLFLLPKCIK